MRKCEYKKIIIYTSCKGMWEGVVTFRRCDSPQGGMKDVRKVCQLMERCDGHGGDLKVLGEV